MAQVVPCDDGEFNPSIHTGKWTWMWWMLTYFIHKYSNSMGQSLRIFVEISSLNVFLSFLVFFFKSPIWPCHGYARSDGWKAVSKCPTLHHPQVEI